MAENGADQQEKFMNEEYVILVDKNDKVIGKETKKDSMFDKKI